MSAVLTGNPFLTSNAQGGFGVQWDGYIQGQAMDDPSARFRLAGGVLADSETIPMWGGVGISESISPNAGGPSNGETGGLITRATQIAQGADQLTGFSVFDQNHAMVNNPQSPVPLAGSKQLVNFYRLGSSARVAVAIDPSLVGLEGSIITTPVSWDFVNQRLQPYDASTATYALTSMTYGATVANGGPGFTVVAAVPTLVGAVGDVVNISGATGNLTANGNFAVAAFTDNEHFVIAAPSATSGAVTGSPVINASTGLLPVKVLNIQIGNSMTVNFDPVTGFATWNRAGSCALIQL